MSLCPLSRSFSSLTKLIPTKNKYAPRQRLFTAQHRLQDFDRPDPFRARVKRFTATSVFLRAKAKSDCDFDDCIKVVFCLPPHICNIQRQSKCLGCENWLLLFSGEHVIVLWFFWWVECSYLMSGTTKCHRNSNWLRFISPAAFGHLALYVLEREWSTVFCNLFWLIHSLNESWRFITVLVIHL